MKSREIKDQIYFQLAKIGKVVSSPKRIELLELLCQGEKKVELLAKQAAMTVKNTSAQLKELKNTRLVESRREGKYIYYKAADDSIAVLLSTLRSLAENRLYEMQETVRLYFDNPESLLSLDSKTLIEKAEKGDIYIIDVRPKEEYDNGHIPNTYSIPLPELQEQLKYLQKDKTTVAYCRGKYCVLSLKAVELLKKHGFKALRYDDGIVEWRAKGLELEFS